MNSYKRKIPLVLGAAVIICICGFSQSSTTTKLFPIKINGKWGFINASGKIAIDPQFDGVNEFSEGLSLVFYGTVQKRAYIDITGRIIIELQSPMNSGEDFSEGLAVVSNQSGKYGYIDKAGKLIIKLEYDKAYKFTEGFARVQADGRYGFIDRQGNQITELIYDQAEDFSSGLAKVIIGQRIGYIDRTGKYIWKLTK